MMINGRPYSNENGYIDDNLITSHPQEEIDTVMGWITENILPRKTPLYGHTSYGIKHLLEHNTQFISPTTSSRAPCCRLATSLLTRMN